MYNSTTALTSTSNPIYNLPRSSLGPMPTSSAHRYGSSIDYTDPYLSRQQPWPTRASCPNLGTPSRFLPARENAGLVTFTSAGTPGACTAMLHVRIPTPQGSNAPVRRVEEGGYLAPSRSHPCHEHRLSLGGNALVDWQMQAGANLVDLPGSASRTPKSHSGCQAPSYSLSTQRGYAPVGMDPYSRGTVRNNGHR